MLSTPEVCLLLWELGLLAPLLTDIMGLLAGRLPFNARVLGRWGEWLLPPKGGVRRLLTAELDTGELDEAVGGVMRGAMLGALTGFEDL